MAGVLAAGWTGPDCMTRQRRPCTNRVRAEGWEPTEQPANLSAGGWTASRCAGRSPSSSVKIRSIYSR